MREFKKKQDLRRSVILLLSGVCVLLVISGCCSAGPAISDTIQNNPDNNGLLPPMILKTVDLKASTKVTTTIAPIYARGAQFTGSYRVRNEGSKKAGQFRINIDMSACNDLCSGTMTYGVYYAPVIGSVVIPSLDAHSETGGTVTLRIPLNCPTGTYYLHEILDPDNAVKESNENNNYIPLFSPGAIIVT